MKHLKSFKIFESNKEDIVSNLRDICLELEDIGFLFNFNQGSNENTIEYIIHKEDSTRFKFSEDVTEVVDRIYQYMRELGWYSHLSYSLGGGIRKKFYIRPDGRMRNQDLLWMDNNWPSVLSIEFFWYKIYEDKTANESISNTSKDVIDTLVWEYGEVIHDMNKDIEFIEDKLLELSDLGYFTTINYSPMTYAGASSNPTIYLDIKKYSPMIQEDFYGNLGENREIVDSVIVDILEYLESSGYKMKNHFGDITQQPSEFEFINNPTSYQIQFVKD